MQVYPGASDTPVDPVARWLAACRLVDRSLSVRLELRGRAGGPEPSADIDLPLVEQRRLLALWERRDRMDPFEVLGLAPTDDPAVIRRAYLETCRRLHPDRFYGKRLGAFEPVLADLFDRARAAHDALVSPRRAGEAR